MFLLRDIPTSEKLRECAGSFHEASPEAVHLWLLLLRVGSDVLDRFERFIGEHGLSQGRFVTLMLLNFCESAARFYSVRRVLRRSARRLGGRVVHDQRRTGHGDPRR